MDDRLVVGVDGSPGSLRALAWAVAEASVRKLLLVPVIVGPHSPSAAALPVDPLVLQGDPADVLCELSAGAVMLVVGAHGHGGVAGMLGSVSLKCAHLSSCPLVIVPPPGDHAPKGEGRIVVGVDRSDSSRVALDWGLEEAGYRGRPVDVVEIWRDPYSDDMELEFELPPLRHDQEDWIRAELGELAAFVESARELHPGLDVQPRLIEGNASAELTVLSQDAELLVVGSRGRSGLARVMLGSVSTAAAHHSHCPVVIVRAHASRKLHIADR